MEEIWIDAFGWYDYYQVSDRGRVRSLERDGLRGFRLYGGGIVRPVLKKQSGYMCVNLTSSTSRKQVLIHRLVLLSFRGEPLKGQECCHYNGDRKDNRLTNLRWDTSKNNHADKRRHGTLLTGEDNINRKLDKESVRYIRDNHEQYSREALKEKFGVTDCTIWRVISGKTWKNI